MHIAWLPFCLMAVGNESGAVKMVLRGGVK